MRPDLKEIVRQAMKDNYGYSYEKFTEIVANDVACRYTKALVVQGMIAQEAERLAGWTPLANARQGVIDAARTMVLFASTHPLTDLRNAVSRLDALDGTAAPIEITVNGTKFTLPALTCLDYHQAVKLSGLPYRADYTIVWGVVGERRGGFLHPPSLNKSELVQISKGMHVTCVFTGNA